MRDRAALVVIGVLSLGVVLVVAWLLLGHPPGVGGRADVSALPAVNGWLNGVSAVLLAAGWILVRRRRLAAHRACMLGAFCVSVLFLLSYVTYHAVAGSRPFTAATRSPTFSPALSAGRPEDTWSMIGGPAAGLIRRQPGSPKW